MTNLHIGDCVTFRDRAYLVRGMSPMGVENRRVQLEDVDTGEHVEASVRLLIGRSAPQVDPLLHPQGQGD